MKTRKFALIILTIILCQNLYSQNSTILTSNGCKVYVGPDITRVTWTGSCLDGYANGYGIRTGFENEILESTYTGNMKAGKRNGQGINTYASGNIYSGNWVDGKKSGQGTFKWINGNKYIGEFSNDMINGKGILYNKAGTVIKNGYWYQELYVGTSIDEYTNSSNKNKEKYTANEIKDCSTCGHKVGVKVYNHSCIGTAEIIAFDFEKGKVFLKLIKCWEYGATNNCKNTGEKFYPGDCFWDYCVNWSTDWNRLIGK